jgi:hypothetical protein
MAQICAKGEQLSQKVIIKYAIILQNAYASMIFLFTTVSRPVLGPTQPPIQWVLGALSTEVKIA